MTESVEYRECMRCHTVYEWGGRPGDPLCDDCIHDLLSSEFGAPRRKPVRTGRMRITIVGGIPEDERVDVEPGRSFTSMGEWLTAVYKATYGTKRR